MPRVLSAGLLLCAAALLSGSCKMTSGAGSWVSTVSSAYYHKPWKGYTTFYIHPDAAKTVSLTALNGPRICAAVSGQMIHKGLTRGDATADLVVNIVSVDSSKDGQGKGRPRNEWFRLFHGAGMNVVNQLPDSLTGSLIPDSLPGKSEGDSARAKPVPAGTTRPAAGKTPADIPSGKTRDTGATVSPQGPPTPHYAYGSLIIEVIDQKRQTLIWEGVADRAVDVPMKDPDRRIRAVIAHIMDRFSPYP